MSTLSFTLVGGLVQMESVLRNSVSNTYYGESAGATKYVLFFTVWSLFNRFKRTPLLKSSESWLTLDTPSSTYPGFFPSWRPNGIASLLHFNNRYSPAAFEVYVRRAYKAYTLLWLRRWHARQWRSPHRCYVQVQSRTIPDTPHISKGYVQMISTSFLLSRVNFFAAPPLVGQLQLVIWPT